MYIIDFIIYFIRALRDALSKIDIGPVSLKSYAVHCQV